MDSSFHAWFNSILIAVSIALLAFALRKIKRIDIKVWDFEAQLECALHRQYRQIEALGALKEVLQINYPLPPMRMWAGSPDFLLVIAQHTLDNKPKNIVECSSGVSTVVLARCIQLNGEGHVFSLENDPVFAEKTRQHLRAHGLTSYATIINAPLVLTDIGNKSHIWYDVRPLGLDAIDLLVIDGPPAHTNATARFPAGPILFSRMSTGGAVFLDDANRSGEREIVRRWIEDNPRVRVEEFDCEKGLVKLSF